MASFQLVCEFLTGSFLPPGSRFPLRRIWGRSGRPSSRRERVRGQSDFMTGRLGDSVDLLFHLERQQNEWYSGCRTGSPPDLADSLQLCGVQE